jgi:uncharacterized membrane protein YfcA
MDWLYLIIITVLAATIQSATGFGFGLIAVPVFLLVLDSAQAIQMVMIIILCMSLVDGWKLKGQSSRRILRWLIIGLVLGFPFGLLIFHTLELPLLKALVAAVILVFSLINLSRLLRGKREEELSSVEPGKWPTLIGGYFSGLMSTSLAMPGPAVMLLLMHYELDKTLIRATILTFFIFAYAGSILLQSLLIGVAGSTWSTSLLLTPFALAGVMAGHHLAAHIDQRLFKLLVLAILLLTSVVMLYQL